MPYNKKVMNKQIEIIIWYNFKPPVKKIVMYSNLENSTGEQDGKINDKNRNFKKEWTDSFTVILNVDYFSDLSHLSWKARKQKEIKFRHTFLYKSQFIRKNPAGGARKRADTELQHQNQKSSSILNKSTQFKYIHRGDYNKVYFVKATEELFYDFDDKAVIITAINLRIS